MSDIFGTLFDAFVIYGLFFADLQDEEEESIEDDGDITLDDYEESAYISDRRKLLYEYDE